MMYYKNKKNILISIALFSLAKIITEIVFVFKAIPLDSFYYYDFNLFKYVNGCIVTGIFLFFFYRSRNKKVSTFLLLLIFLISLFPLTIVYAFMDLSLLFYNLTSGMLMVVLIVNEKLGVKEDNTNDKVPMIRGWLDVTIVVFSITVLAFFMIVVITNNGLPKLTALDISKVYEVRNIGFLENKYMGYLYPVITFAIIPFLFSVLFYRKSYIFCAGLLGILFLLFLYGGDKSVLFSVVLILGSTIICRFKNKKLALINFYSVFLIAANFLWIFANHYTVYSLFIRRMIIVPAYDKFQHFAFFSSNPQLGLSGSLMGKITEENGVMYPGLIFEEGYTNIIGRTMFGLPEMSVNTGFLVEGFDRFGYIGFIVIALALLCVLMIFDYLQTKVGIKMTIICCTYFIFSLNDLFLLNRLMLGPGLALICIGIFYGGSEKKRRELR